MADILSSSIQAKSDTKREQHRQELEETIEAIRNGLVDALIVQTGSGQRVHALHPLEQIEELNEVFQAIREGRVDALVVKTPAGERVFLLEGSDTPYRVLIETMQEGAATLDGDGTVLYANARFAEIIGVPVEKIFGVSVYRQFQPDEEENLRLLIEEGLRKTAKGEVGFQDQHGRNRHLRLALSPLPNYGRSEQRAVCMVATEVTELFEANESLQQLSARLLQSQDEERRRISRDLHDSAGQYLASAQMSLTQLEQRLASSCEPEALVPLVADVHQAVSECSKEIRTLSYLLHPPTLDLVGLTSAIQWYTEGFSQRSGIAVDLEIAPSLDRLQPQLEIVIYRIVQESLTNIHRHSGSKWAGIRLVEDQDQITLEVADRGKGMGSGNAENPKMYVGVGISGIRERVRHLNGHLAIESTPQGTTVRVVFSLAQGRTANA